MTGHFLTAETTRAPQITTNEDKNSREPRRRWRKIRRFIAIGMFLWLIMAVVIALAIIGYGQVSHERDADVIIVLGAGLRRDGRPGPALIRRAEEGARLYREGYATNVICTGAIPRFANRAEAEGCADVLRENGVPDSAIVLETRSRSTEENAAYSLEIMNEQGWELALVVSDGYHLLRARWIFADQGVEAYTVPASRQPRTFDLATALAREVVAVHWQVFKTVLNLPYTFVPWV